MEFFADVDDFCEEHPDVVVLATSILSLEAVMRSLPVQRLRRNTLFVDVLSVKEFPKRLLLSLLPAEVRRRPLACFLDVFRRINELFVLIACPVYPGAWRRLQVCF